MISEEWVECEKEVEREMERGGERRGGGEKGCWKES